MRILRALGRTLIRLSRDDSGQAMTEAALILPLFLTTVAMTLELCVIATTRSVVNYAAYSACRAGIVHNGDPQPMVIAASIALSPVAQSEFFPTRPGTVGYDTYGTWRHQRVFDEDGNEIVNPTEFSTQPTATKILDRTFNLLAGTGASMLQFTSGWSQLEYLSSNIAAGQAHYDAIMEDLKNGDFLGLITSIGDAIGFIQAALGEPPINQLQVLRADPIEAAGNPAQVIAKTGDLFNPFAWADPPVMTDFGAETSDLLTEAGGTADGYDWGVNNYRGNSGKPLRLRIRLIHRYRLMFPFLRIVYENVLTQRNEEGRAVSAGDTETHRVATTYMMVEIWSDCVMRMQSNLTLDQAEAD